MSDEMMQTFARAVREGDPSAEQKYIAENMRTKGIAKGVEEFLGLLNERLKKQNEAAFEGNAVTLSRVKLDETTKLASQKFARIVSYTPRDGVENHRSVYCFVEIATGNILKPGGWKAPEPKKIPRGNIFGLDPLAGCGPHGVAYVGSGHFNYGWAPGVVTDEYSPNAIGPSRAKVV